MSTPEWQQIQENTFRRWCNQNLKSRNVKIDNLSQGFSDGVQLITLLEVLSKKKLGRPYNKDPEQRAQKLDNCQLALNFVKSEGLYTVNIGNADIVDGNLKLILGLVWTLILHYQISLVFQDDPGDQGKKLSPKQALLAWIQEKLPDKGIKNFTTDWKSGINLAALVDSVVPGLCPEHATMDESLSLQNAKLAMYRAEQGLDIPQVLTPEELVSSEIDEPSVMTYMSFFRQCKLKAGFSLFDLPVPVNEEAIALPALVKESVTFPKIKDPSEQKPKHPSEDTDETDAVPVDPSTWTADGPGIGKSVQAYNETHFTIHPGSGKLSELQVKVVNKSQGRMELPIEVKPNKDGTITVTYSTVEPGHYRVSIFVAELDITGSPFEVAVIDLTKVRVVGPGKALKVGDIFTFNVDASFAGPGQVTASAITPDGDEQQCEVAAVSKGKYKAEIALDKNGEYKITVSLGGTPVSTTPMVVAVLDSERQEPNVSVTCKFNLLV